MLAVCYKLLRDLRAVTTVIVFNSRVQCALLVCAQCGNSELGCAEVGQQGDRRRLRAVNGELRGGNVNALRERDRHSCARVLNKLYVRLYCILSWRKTPYNRLTRLEINTELVPIVVLLDIIIRLFASKVQDVRALQIRRALLHAYYPVKRDRVGLNLGLWIAYRDDALCAVPA